MRGNDTDRQSVHLVHASHVQKSQGEARLMPGASNAIQMAVNQEMEPLLPVSQHLNKQEAGLEPRNSMIWDVGILTSEPTTYP